MTGAAHLSGSDESHLDWFFSAGQLLLGSSVSGPILDRIRDHAIVHVMHPDTWAEVQRRRPNAPPPDAVTARPTGSSRDEAGYTPDEAALRRYAHISRRLAALERRDPRSAAVLCAYYGDQGARWARTDLGRLFALWLLTCAGRALLERSDADMRRRKAQVAAAPLERLANEAQLERVRPQPGRRALLDRARCESLAMYRSACQLWTSMGPR